MKITIDLPDELLVAAEKAVAARRMSLGELVARALRRELKRETKRPPGEAAGLRLVAVKGGLPPGLDVRNREAMREWSGTTR